MNEKLLLLLEKTLPLQKRAEELDAWIASPEIIADNRLYRRLAWERAELADIAECRRALEKTVEQLQTIAFSRQSAEAELLVLLLEEEKTLLKHADYLADTLSSLLKQKNDGKQVVLEILSEDNGSTSLQFCGELAKMYVSYAGLNGWDIQETSSLPAADGYKRITFLVSGSGAWTSLQEENGLHRATGLDGGKRSALACVVTVLYSPYIPSVPSEKDIRTDIFRSSGAGGQNVNKVETAVRMTHLPTGIAVTCQDERSQLKNRERAYRHLLERVDAFYRKENDTAFEKEKKRRAAEARTGANMRIYDYLLDRVTSQRTGISAPLRQTLAEGPAAFESLRISGK
jgi:peptide chain release factor 1